jgi:ribosomal protein S18 acetylase RimI-like enzyme
MEIRPIESATPEVVEAVNRLLPALSPDAPPLTEAGLSAILAHPAVTLFGATEDGRIVGCLTLVTYPAPTGSRAWIEDVVVAPDVRERGTGTALVTAAIEAARRSGARALDLTCRPDRTEAVRLYRRMGFANPTSDVFRLPLS